MSKEEKKVENVTEEKASEKMVYVPKAEFDELKEMVQQIADKNRLDRFNESRKKNVRPIYKLSTIEGKIVVGWKTIKDDVSVDPISGRVIAHQIYQFILEDKSTVEVNGYNNFANAQYSAQIEAEGLSKKIDGDSGNTFLELETKDGRKVEINEKFVN